MACHVFKTLFVASWDRSVCRSPAQTDAPRRFLRERPLTSLKTCLALLRDSIGLAKTLQMLVDEAQPP